MGRGAQRAAWVAPFQAEAAAFNKFSHAVALLDLVKYLVPAARRHGYSIVLLRLSLAAYRSRRSLLVHSDRDPRYYRWL